MNNLDLARACAPLSEAEADALWSQCMVDHKRPGPLQLINAYLSRGVTPKRQPLTLLQINTLINGIGTYSGDYEDAIVRAVERHHGIIGA